VVAPVQSGSQDLGDRAGIFLHDFDGGRVVGHDGNLPEFAFALLLPDGQVGVVMLTNTATLFGAPLSPRRPFARGLGLPPAGPGCRALMCLSVRISEGPGFLTNVPSRRLRRGARLTLWRDDPRSFQLNVDGTSLDASGSLVITFTGAPRIYFPSIERRGSIDLMVVHQGRVHCVCSSGARCCDVDTAHDLGLDNEAIGRLGCQPHR
jgi:hypothetical protein